MPLCTYFSKLAELMMMNLAWLLACRVILNNFGACTKVVQCDPAGVSCAS